MAALKPDRRHSPIGIDIGERAVRAVPFAAGSGARCAVTQGHLGGATGDRETEQEGGDSAHARCSASSGPNPTTGPHCVFLARTATGAAGEEPTVGAR